MLCGESDYILTQMEDYGVVTLLNQVEIAFKDVSPEVDDCPEVVEEIIILSERCRPGDCA